MIIILLSVPQTIAVYCMQLMLPERKVSSAVSFKLDRRLNPLANISNISRNPKWSYFKIKYTAHGYCTARDLFPSLSVFQKKQQLGTGKSCIAHHRSAVRMRSGCHGNLTGLSFFSPPSLSPRSLPRSLCFHSAECFTVKIDLHTAYLFIFQH